jgi:hypothetical protein
MQSTFGLHHLSGQPDIDHERVNTNGYPPAILAQAITDQSLPFHHQP